MTSTRVLAEFGECIAEDGPAAALADRTAPDVVRQRALAVASAVLLCTAHSSTRRAGTHR